MIGYKIIICTISIPATGSPGCPGRSPIHLITPYQGAASGLSTITMSSNSNGQRGWGCGGGRGCGGGLGSGAGWSELLTVDGGVSGTDDWLVSLCTSELLESESAELLDTNLSRRFCLTNSASSTSLFKSFVAKFRDCCALLDGVCSVVVFVESRSALESSGVLCRRGGCVGGVMGVGMDACAEGGVDGSVGGGVRGGVDSCMGKFGGVAARSPG